jgi:lactonase
MKNNLQQNEQKFGIPLPPDLANLPIIKAEPWVQVAPEPNHTLEGPAFDKQGNLFITDPPWGTIYKITPDRKLSTIFNNKKIIVDGAAFDKDGRLFVVCISGEILVFDLQANQISCLYPKYHEKMLSMNDLVFDDKGNIYVTDFTGTEMDPTGGVYRISCDGKIVQAVLQHMASPNGVSLSPEGSALWVGESTRNAIIHINLSEDGITPTPIVGVVCVYRSCGFPGPDSNKVDSQGNLYQCIMGQGRIVVLEAHGIPVANVIVEGRERGESLRTTNLAFKPGTDEGYITTSGYNGGWIFKFKGLAEGLPLFSH